MSYVVPTSQYIKEDGDIEVWQSSETFQVYWAFLEKTNRAITGKAKSEAPKNPSNVITSLVSMLDTMNAWLADFPAIKGAARFGNKAFADWYAKIDSEKEALLGACLPDHLKPAAAELGVYLVHSLGNPVRIDYGTGHETTFAMLLCAMDVIGCFNESEGDYAALPLLVFDRYMILVRSFQIQYMLEPAGSHGVWCLDDYQFLVFLWGSAQLIDHPRIKPKSILSQDIRDMFSTEYMYLAAVEFICKVKTGPFSEHSPILNDITALPHWRKLNGGMFKMYKVEVLGKLPIMQHTLFGSILKAPTALADRK